MKIAHFCDSINQGGGISSFVSSLTSEQSINNEITIGVISKSQSQDVIFEPNINVHNFGKSSQGFSIKYPLLIFIFLLKNKYDIVHIHSSFLYYALSIILLRWKMKFIYTVHSDAKMENSSIWDKRFLWLKKFCFKHKYLYPVTISSASKLSFDNLYRMDSHMIENGIRRPLIKNPTTKLKKYRYTNNTLLFLHPGRISEAKNQITLCRVFKRLIDDGYDITLIIAGVKQDQKIFSELEKYFTDRIVYLGERNDIIDLMRESDAMCLSSIWEGLPITLLEAISVGCIPICTPVGGIPNVITHNTNGILSKSSKEDDFYNAVMHFINIPNNTKDKIRIAAKESFEDYDIKRTSQNYINYYETIIRN